MPLAAPRTRLVELKVEGLSATRLELALRSNQVPIICRLEDRRLLIDPRTLVEDDMQVITNAIKQIAH
jgi:L-seryl-tRNA(Ser) seleniumtransferase